MKTISATSYKMYETCPYQWMLKYKVNCLQMPNPAFIIGTAFHKGVEKFHTGRSVEDVVAELKKEMLNGTATTGEQIDMFGLVRQMVEAYARNPVTYATIETEYQFNIPVFGVTAPLFGFIDRVVEGGVVEYKTSAKDYTIDDIDNIQTDIYSFAYRQRFHAIPRVTYCVMNKEKAKRSDYRPQILEITREEARMEELVGKLARFEHSVKIDNFEPKPATHCRWCPFADSCKYK